MSHSWKTELEAAGLKLLAIALPPVCVACQRIEGIEALALGLCSRCHRRLEPTPRAGCIGCGKPLETDPLPEAYLCGSCRRVSPPYRRIESGWLYQPPLEEVIHAMKFRRLAFLGHHLGRELSHHHRHLGPESDLVVPVPLHWLRHLRRGFNQAEEIARPLAVGLGLPLVRALRRRSATRPQAALDRAARTRNLQGAFAATRAGRRRLQGQRALLVDDVVTTRNTLTAATRCLLTCGASSVICLTAGRTPEPI